jgi:enediyne biosynthesis protein E4
MKALPGFCLGLVTMTCLAVDGPTGSGFRGSPLLPPSGDGRVGFDRIPPASVGITFTNELSAERAGQFQNLMNGSGVAAADVDGDGWVDLFFCHRQSVSRLYRNLGGVRFEDITAKAGLAALKLNASGAIFGDIDGDGSPDLVVSSFGGPHACFKNDGKGNFREVTAEAGITGKSGSTSIALSDVDGDGDLDLYWCNFALEALLRDGSNVTTRMVDGKPVVTGRYAKRLRVVDGNLIELGDPDVLYLNDGTGRFSPAPWEAHFQDHDGTPVPPPPDLGLAVQIRDIDGNGTPDIYVCNDFHTPDRIWLGDGKGHFRAPSPWALRNMTFASMGVDFADLDRDGHLEFVTLDMMHRDLRRNLRTTRFSLNNRRSPGLSPDRQDVPRNCLYWNRGDGTWAEIGIFAGLAATGWSWTPLFLDVDLDGWEDLLVSNGYHHDVNDWDTSDRIRAQDAQTRRGARNLLRDYPPLTPPKYAFRNGRDLTFEEVGAEWGFAMTDIAHGMIAVDLDHDGDLDIVANCMPGTPLLLLNRTHAPRLTVRLLGRRGNQDGLGAKITVSGGPVVQTQEIVAGGQYLSHGEPIRTFAAGSGSMSVEVRWRSGRVSRMSGAKAGWIQVVDESQATESAASPAGLASTPGATVPGLFRDATANLGHRHQEEPFDDFASQPQLPRRLGQEGPSVLATDLDKDGNVDVVLGSGRGGRLTVKLGDGKGGFRALETDGPELPDDLLGLAFLPGAAEGDGVVAGALASFESSMTNGPSVLRWRVTREGLRSLPPLPSIGASPSALAAADFDGDGDQDLFVGGRVVPGRWPVPASSMVFLSEGGTMRADPMATEVFRRLGLVTAAVSGDLDSDGRPELVVAAEFGTIRVFSRRESGWEERTRALGLESGVGLWNSVAVADLNGDGRLDLIAGNEGSNTHRTLWGLPAVFWKEAGDDRPLALVEAAMQGGVPVPVRDRDHLATTIPDIADRFPNHTSYSNADALAVLGATAPGRIEVTHVRSAVFLRGANGYVRAELPREAQWTPVSGIAVADFDQDGRNDLFLSQNRFAMRPEDMACDAGVGCVLLGDGQGGFRAVPANRLGGLRVLGEQRGCASADFDGDRRPDLIVSQNGSETRMFLGRRP